MGAPTETEGKGNFADRTLIVKGSNPEEVMASLNAKGEETNEDIEVARLLVLDESAFQIRPIQSNERLLVIGSGDDADVDLCLEGDAVARRQIVIANMGEQWLLMNADSGFDVRFDGVPCDQKVVADSERCVIQIDVWRLIFEGGSFSSYQEDGDAKPKLMVTDSMKMAKASLRRSTDSISLKKPGSLNSNASSQNARALFHVQCMKNSATFTGRPILIGSNDSCDVVVKHSSIKPFNTMVYANADGLFVDPLSSSRVKFKKIPIHRTAMIVENGAEAQIGSFAYGDPVYNLRVSWESELDDYFQSMRVQQRPLPYFAFNASSNSEAESFTIGRQVTPMTIGRQGGSADIALNDSATSRRHAEIIPQGDRLTIRDLGSSNGTFVNQTKIEQAQVRIGDSVQFGASCFFISYAGED